MITSGSIQRRWVMCAGWTLSMIFAFSCMALAKAPEIKISVDRSSLNQMLSHLQGAVFAKTWDEMPFRPALSLRVDHAEVVTIRHTNGTIDLQLKGNVQLHYYILEAEQHSSLGFTAQMQTRPVSTNTAILLQVVTAEISLDDPPIPDTIELFPIEDLVRTILLPEYIPLLDMQDLKKIGIPLPGKSPVTVRPITPRIRVGKDRLVLFMTLQIESSPSSAD